MFVGLLCTKYLAIHGTYLSFYYSIDTASYRACGWLRHVTHMTESYVPHTNSQVMSRKCLSHGTRMTEACALHELTSRVTQITESCQIYDCAISLTRTQTFSLSMTTAKPCSGTHTNSSSHKDISQPCHAHELRHTYEWVTASSPSDITHTDSDTHTNLSRRKKYLGYVTHTNWDLESLHNHSQTLLWSCHSQCRLCCRVLWCVAVCCNVLQRVAACCSVLHAVRYTMLSSCNSQWRLSVCVCAGGFCLFVWVFCTGVEVCLCVCVYTHEHIHKHTSNTAPRTQKGGEKKLNSTTQVWRTDPKANLKKKRIPQARRHEPKSDLHAQLLGPLFALSIPVSIMSAIVLLFLRDQCIVLYNTKSICRSIICYSCFQSLHPLCQLLCCCFYEINVIYYITWDQSVDALCVIRATGWRRPIGCLISCITFRKLATNYRALVRKMTYIDRASYDSTPLCITSSTHHVIVLWYPIIWDQSLDPLWDGYG